MSGLLLTVIIYYGVAIFLFIGINSGYMELNITSKKTGELLDVDSKMYKFITFTYCFGWLYPAIVLIKRRLKDEFSNKDS